MAAILSRGRWINLTQQNANEVHDIWDTLDWVARVIDKRNVYKYKWD